MRAKQFWRVVREMWVPGMVLAVAFVALGMAALATPSAVDYRAATPCNSTAYRSTNCYTTMQGTIAAFHNTSTARAGGSEISLLLPTGPASTTAGASDLEMAVLRPGVAVTVEFYHGQITALKAGEVRIETGANPNLKQTGPLIAGLIFLGFGLVFLAFSLVARWIVNWRGRRGESAGTVPNDAGEELRDRLPGY